METIKMMVLRSFEKNPGRSMDMLEHIFRLSDWSELEEKLLFSPGQPSATVMIGLPELSPTCRGSLELGHQLLGNRSY